MDLLGKMFRMQENFKTLKFKTLNCNLTFPHKNAIIHVVVSIAYEVHMKITSVKTYIVDGGFRPWTFVRVETDQPGLVGWGDCTDWGSPGPVAATVDRYGEWVIGRDPMQAEAIWWDLSTASQRHIGGIASKAMSGIDSALWDIRGKVLGAPVWQLLGGKMRDKLRLYWTHCGTTRAAHADRLGL